jgi:Lactonase, 7-bladed beta-propeller
LAGCHGRIAIARNAARRGSAPLGIPSAAPDRLGAQRAGILAPIQVITTLPMDFAGHSTATEIAVSADGHFVSCSNRGHDSVAIFAADVATGATRSDRLAADNGPHASLHWA